MHSPYETVIGLEVHVQLATATKLFCGCANDFGAPPNTHICPVCTGQPGALPAPNSEAIRLAITAGLALHCEIAAIMQFDRKNYFYPDLPKGYQITQLGRPVNGAGSIEIESDDGAMRHIGIARAHLEEDAGKTQHPAGAAHSLVDFNRAGVPLLEIVSAPDLRSPQEAHRYLDEIKLRLRFARVSECDMEKGSLRCDANISLRPAGATRFGTRVEIKNLNSFRNVERALEHEAARQAAILDAGGAVEQETRSWQVDAERTTTLRKKEEAEDYRYFPDPDLPPIAVPQEFVASLRSSLPEMPDEKKVRYARSLSLPGATIDSLVQERDVAEYFDRCIEAMNTGEKSDPRTIANLVLGTALALANERGVPLSQLSLSPRELAAVAAAIDARRLSSQAARTKLLPALVDSGRSAAQLMTELGLEQVSDASELDRFIEAAIASNAKAVAEFRAGKAAALNSLVGAVMKASQGRANPNLVREQLSKRLGS